MRKYYKRQKIRYVTMDEWIRRYEECKKYTIMNIVDLDKAVDVTGDKNKYAFINEKKSTIELITPLSEECNAVYVARLDREEDSFDTVAPTVAWSIFQRMTHTPKFEAPFSASPFVEANPLYDHKRTHAYYYDLNSAYATVMLKEDFPDTTKGRMMDDVREGAIGFDFDGELVYPGEYADYVFPLMPSPYVKYVLRYYEQKKNAKTKGEKNKAKAMLNIPTGYLQNHNPVIRAFIVNKCAEKIKNIIKKIGDNFITGNTDCIVSAVPLPFLDVGEEIGQWKFKEGTIAMIATNYQWNYEVPTYRGIPKGWWEQYGKEFDLLKVEIPNCGNIYHFDEDKKEIVRL